MAIAIRSMFKEYLQDSGRHKLATNSPDTKIAIQLEDNSQVQQQVNLRRHRR